LPKESFLQIDNKIDTRNTYILSKELGNEISDIMRSSIKANKEISNPCIKETPLSKNK